MLLGRLLNKMKAHLIIITLIFIHLRQFKTGESELQVPKFDCERVRAVFRHLVKGQPGIPTVEISDPEKIPDFTERSDNLNAEFKNSSVYGLSSFIISYVDLDFVKLKLKVGVNVSQINLRGEYALEHKSLFLTLRGTGPFWMNITDIYVFCEVALTSDEMGRLQVLDVDADITIKDMFIHFENISFEKLANSIINRLSSTMFQKMKPTILNRMKNVIFTRGDEFFASLPPNRFLFSPLFPIDVVLLDVSDRIKNERFDPKELPSQSWGFERTILYVQFYGNVKLYDGYIKGLSTIHRTSNVDAEFRNGSLKLSVGLGFDYVEAGYKMSVEFQGLEKIGGVHLSVESVDVSLVLELTDDTLPPSVKEFRIVDIHQVVTDVDGLGSLDFLVEFITNSFVNVFKYELSKLVEKDVGKIIEDSIKKFTFNNTCDKDLM